MGIDVYMRWPGQTEEEREAQYDAEYEEYGKVGYLRESYHGAPYATRVLVPETWDDYDGPEEASEGPWEHGVPIEAKTLRERLPAALWAACVRRAEVYNDTDMRRAIMNSTGYEPRFNPEDEPGVVDLTDDAESTEDALRQLGPLIAKRLAESLQAHKLPAAPEWWEMVPEGTDKPYYEIVAGVVKGSVLHILHFVQLAERKEAETGKPVGIVNSC